MGYWLVTWEWAASYAKVDEPVAAVLNSRLSSERVCEIVELMYANASYTVGERLAYAKDKKKNPYPATLGFLGKIRWQGEIICGHNPYLRARLVDKIKVEWNENGKEIVTWEERPKPKIQPDWISDAGG